MVGKKTVFDFAVVHTAGCFTLYSFIINTKKILNKLQKHKENTKKHYSQ